MNAKANMFHTWETSQFQCQDPNETSGSSLGKRKSSTVRACEPCRRRKIKCGGEYPCETCQWYRKASGCHYTEPRQRQMPTKKSLEKANETLRDYRAVLQKLFPATHPDQLKELNRESLLDLVAKSSPTTILSPPSPITPGLDERTPEINSDAANLEQLQPMPEDSADETESQTSGLKGITDEVNALSLSFKKSTSYLGISSVTAVLRVILWLDPEAQAFFVKPPEQCKLPSHETSIPTEPNLELADSSEDVLEEESSAWEEIPFINAYFNFVHPAAPLIDEQHFRDTYMTKRRSDSRWKLLLNTVLALGSVADSSHFEESSHRIYWRRAKQCLDVDTLNSAHIETVQALTLLSGLYLHYIQQPNLANSLMGATLRLATALGLHRDYSESVNPVKRDKAGHSIDMRRRVWWSVFVLDAWAGYGLGRPSMGRMNNAVTAKAPQEAINSGPGLLSLIQENISFCKITTRMEDALASSPIIPEAERRALDTALVEWYQSSSVQNNADTTPRAHTGEVEGVAVTRNILRWRFLLCRILIHRPVLLWAAMRKATFSTLPPMKYQAIQVCRETTYELIHDIATTWKMPRSCAMAGWPGTWLLYQALMVPLLHLFADCTDETWNQKNKELIEVGLAALLELKPWSQTASRSTEVISRIYEASKRHALPRTVADIDTKQEVTKPVGAIPPAQNHQQHHNGPLDFTMNDSPTQEIYMNNMFDSLNWSDNWVEESFPYNQAVLSFDNDQGGMMGMSNSYDPFMSTGSYGDNGHPYSQLPHDGFEGPQSDDQHYQYYHPG